MKSKKHVLAMTIPFMLVGINACREYEHPVVIEGLGSLGPNDHFAKLRDVETDSIKLYYWDHKPNLFDSFRLHDTAYVLCHEGFYNQEVYYNNHRIISYRDASMNVDGRTMAARNPDNKLMQLIGPGGKIRVY